jgi:FAD/FMN-containing dehydrogenase/Fe-S oxidoreductase
MTIYTDSLHKIAYATDASVYREIPYGVAYPETVDDVRSLLRVAKEKGLDLIPRAGGTSIAGQVVGSGIVADISKHWNKILQINAEEQWARVQPGVVRDELNIALKPYGLFFSPETSTSNRCCIGGMLGNNSCGTHSLVYGSTRHHIIAARGVLTDGSEEFFKEYKIKDLEERFGREFWKETKHESLIEGIYAQLIGFASDKTIAGLIADNYPDRELKRRSCGYAIDETIEPLNDESLPFGERTINLCKLIAGSEGTLCFITEITVGLDALPPKEIMVVCGHCDDLMKSFKANLTALHHQPTAIELMDGDILELSKGNKEQQKNRFFVEGNPAALLISEFRADSRNELDRKADALEQELLKSGLVYKCTRVYGEAVNRVWALRKAGLGVLGGMKGDSRPMGVIEDTAVAPKRLPAYMKDFRELVERLDARCVFYGHISTGELHLRPIINLKTAEGRKLFRQIAQETALLVKKHRGSISGEHGDGRLRGEFIPLLYGQETYQLMRKVKRCWDPDGLLNRHKIVDTLPMDSMLRFEEDQSYEIEKITGADNTYFNWKAAFDEDKTAGATGAKTQVHALMCSLEQCNGAGDCRKSNLIGGTMCPAYKVSGDETKTTRARANVLREILTRGGDISNVKEVLDDCLACKGCRRECPSNVDMTRIKAEVLQHYYEKNGMPLRTWLVARFPLVAKTGRLIRPLYNFAARWQTSANIIKRIVDFAPERSIPTLSTKTMEQLVKGWLRKEAKSDASRLVYLYADEFINQQESEIGLAFAKLLTKLGYRVQTITQDSGRAAISKGCLKLAKRIAQRNVGQLQDIINEEHPLVGIEPSAILTFRDEYPDLVTAQQRVSAIELGKHCLLYDEFLLREIAAGRISKENFKNDEMDIWLHGHCHQKALVGIEKTAEMLKLLLWARVHVIPSGCCGMAGSFGYEKEHYKTSLAIGEMLLFPAIREAQRTHAMSRHPEAPMFVAAPGTSCRRQIFDGTSIRAVHPIEILYTYTK